MERFDVAIIGAGMSGLAAGIRAAHFGKRVVILEQHNAPGGLNSFYAKDGRQYDVGLHAMTNYAPASARGAVLGKILRQLRIDRAELDLIEQRGSRVAFPSADLRFDNDPALLVSEVERVFPDQAEGFRRLSAVVAAFPDAELTGAFRSTRSWIREYVSDPLLEDMLFCPLMYYGSAVEDDMDVGQFVIMFRSIFLEGLARPVGGIRVMIRAVLDRYRKLGGIRRMKTGVARLVVEGGKVGRIVLESGEEIAADVVLSSAGLPETFALCEPRLAMPGGAPAPEGRLAFTETISVFSTLPETWGWGDDTIVFFSRDDRFAYREPREPVDLRSGVICMPNNFHFGDRALSEGAVRVTCLANHDVWASYADSEYEAAKELWFDRIWQCIRPAMPKPTRDFMPDRVATDMFTPRTVTRFTRRARGAIYGSPQKSKDGSTPVANLFLCGTDQGYLGIVGSMLSGIVVANDRVLKGGR